ncbi:MAG: PQQ-binding-like beta-propeller repeat protein [Gemmataceae bacterium]|nr:PQQ-binding-like beta-propeller repeat protein [Gemmataceae bacterium]
MARTWLLGGLLMLPLGGWAVGQTDGRVLTSPTVPRREILERLGLELAWRTHIRFQGGRDGLFGVQVIPGPRGPDLLVQTRAGAVLLFDAETGDLRWRMALEGTVLAAAGFNTRSIFVARGSQLYVLSRRNGMHRIYATQPGYPEPVMGYTLPATPSAPLVADDAGLFVAMGQRLTAYVHPEFQKTIEFVKMERDKRLEATQPDVEPSPLDIDKLKAKERAGLLEALEKIHAAADKPPVEISKGTTVQPVELWSYYTRATAIQQPPLTTYEQVNVVTTDGIFVALNRFELFQNFEFKTQGNVSAPMNQYGLTAYVGSDDFSLYAFGMHSGKILWRFIAEAPIERRPEVTDRDIFVTASGVGMYRLERETGRKIWLNRRAEQYLASNPKFVYAVDRQGFLLVIDAERGATMAVWDARDWTVTVANEWTDRFYLAATDGQLICLRHRDLASPVTSRTYFTLKREEPKKIVEPKKDNGDKKEPEKKDDKAGLGALRPPGRASGDVVGPAWSELMVVRRPPGVDAPWRPR